MTHPLADILDLPAIEADVDRRIAELLAKPKKKRVVRYRNGKNVRLGWATVRQCRICKCSYNWKIRKKRNLRLATIVCSPECAKEVFKQRLKARQKRRVREDNRRRQRLNSMKNMEWAISEMTKHKNLLTPEQTAAMRGRIAGIIHGNLQMAEEVLAGNLNWTQAQLRLFAKLIDKAVPDLNASYVQLETDRSKDTSKMTRAEIEAYLRSDAIAEITAGTHSQGKGVPTAERQMDRVGKKLGLGQDIEDAEIIEEDDE